MNPIFFFWALFTRSTLRNLVPDHINGTERISRFFSCLYVGLVQLEPVRRTKHVVCLISCKYKAGVIRMSDIGSIICVTSL